LKKFLKIFSAVFFLLFSRVGYSQFPVPGGNVPSDTSKSAKDSTKKKLSPSASLLLPGVLKNNQYYKTASFPEPDVVLTYLEYERPFSFVQSLGQMGKPYQRYKYGMPLQLTGNDGFTDPLHDREDIFILDPEKDVGYFDTRTPLARMDYTQGPDFPECRSADKFFRLLFKKAMRWVLFRNVHGSVQPLPFCTFTIPQRQVPHIYQHNL
jgi:hypothetical protein